MLPEDLHKTKKIAAVRIHVKRIFKILSDEIDATFLIYYNKQ